MKKIIILLFFGLSTSLTIQAQESNKPGEPIGGIIVKGGRNPGGSMLLNFSGGSFNPNSNTKNNSFLGNGINFNLGAYLPLYSFGPNNNFTLGPNIGASYFNLNGDVNATPKFNVTGQSSMPTATKSGNGNASGFTAEAGLHANFSFGKITISSILNVGYLGFQQDAFRVTQTNQANGNSYDNDLYSQKEIKENGFAFIPKLRIGYFPGKLGFFLESNYTMGPDITSSQSTLKPSGSGNVKDGSYQIDQLKAGKQVTSERVTPFKNLGFNFGVSYAILRRSIPTNSNPGSSARKRVVVLKSNRTNDTTFGEKVNQGLSVSPTNSVDEKKSTNEEGGLITKNPMFQENLVYAHDYSITDGEILSYLHTDQLVIKKGTYQPDFSNNPFGDITLELAIPISAKGITQSEIKRLISEPIITKGINESGVARALRSPPTEDRSITESGIKRTENQPANEKGITESGIKKTDITPTNKKAINQAGLKRQQFSGIRCDAACTEEGDYCFTCKKSSASALFYEFEIIPVVENEMITNIILSNSNVSKNGIPVTGYNPTGQPQNQSIVNTSKSNTKDRVATDLGTGDGTNPAGQPQNQNVVNTSKSNTKDRISPDLGTGNGTNPAGQPQNQSIVNTTKSNTKDRVATDLGTGDGTNPAGQPQNQSIVNTLKSNTKDRVATDLGTGDGTNPAGQPQNQNVVNTSKSNTKDRISPDLGTGNGTNPAGQPQNQNVVNTSKSNTKDRVATDLGTGDGTNPAGQPQNQNVVNTSKSNTKDKVATDLGTGDGTNPAGQPQNQNVVNTTKSNTKDRIAAENTEMMQVAYTGQDLVLKQTQLSVFGSGRTLADGTPVVAGRVVGGKITGSIIINNGNLRVNNIISIKQPESGDEGSAVLDKEGNFTINLGSDTLHRIYINDKEFGKIKLESQQATTTSSNAPKSPLYETAGTSGENPMFESSNVARPGAPIGGVVVKGGKNPGGQMRIISGSDGSFTFQNPNTADFKFTIETPENSGGNGNAARPGNPIGGIVVKGGKNPGGQMFTTTANGKGEVEFKNLPAGNYKFTVTAPTEPKQYESYRKGWDGTVKGGSKKEIKTQSPLYQSQNTEHMSPLYKGN